MPDTESPARPKVAIVGGGMTGISAALELARINLCDITLYEKDTSLGGLSSSFTWEDVTWDRFYHVVLSTDTPLREFLQEIGLQEEMFWRETKVGFYGDGKLVSLSSSWDFLTFPFMSLWQKFRLGLGILKSARIKDPSKLDKIYVREWLTSMFGRRVYENIWDPLLRSKLGAAREKTSAAFIWATINRLYGARGGGADKKELMGHVRGGYHAILSSAQRALESKSVTIKTGAAVTSVTENEGGVVRVATSGEEAVFDKVILTIPCPEILRLTGADRSIRYWRSLEQVEYLSIACVVLVLSRPLSEYYVTNLLDKSLPFTGVIEATNIVSPDDLGGKHLIYLPKYMPAGDPVNRWEDAKVINEFTAALQKIFPDLQNNEILHTRLFREQYVQPIQEVNFLERKKGFRSPTPGLYVVNTSMIYNSTLNNNAAVTLGRDCSRELVADLEL